MRWTQTLIPTLREVPKEVEALSHRLLLRGGFIRKLSAGVYSYLPLGFRVLQKIVSIIRDEMAKASAEEVLLPALHPAELWKKTGRFDLLGEDKISFINRSGQEFVLGPTHEEIITELVGAYVQSYQDLPLTLYQIQTKFRDELRPRFGIVRTKEFIMKDAYSFHRDEESLKKTYEVIYEVYKRIMKRCGIQVKIVSADTGVMGGAVSHEFMKVCPYGEDHIVICKKCDTAVSRDLAERAIDSKAVLDQGEAQKKLEAFETPNLKTIDELTNHFGIRAEQMVKTILYVAGGEMVAACVDGATEVNEGKLRKAIQAKELRLATSEEIEKATGAPLGFSGPVGLKHIKIVIDADILKMQNFVTGANQKDKHFKNVNLGRDFKADLIADIRYAREDDHCPKCHETYQFLTAMEVGHTFQLGTRYSKALEATYHDEAGEIHPIVMGCYGIGVNRLLAAAIEECHDEKGVIWPVTIAPFQAVLMTLNEQDEASRRVAEEVYGQLTQAGIDLLYDDRRERAGVKFNDADLIGIPIHVIISERNLAKHQIEIKTR
ncbi:MAG: proline--tRNA ligase, partial [Candidatus Omnitrophica bacterium]|nr:proline--tRNA ligase [Candidatus Omnitrophota bacterium]